MSTDSELRDSIERTKQAFRSGQEAPVRLADLAGPTNPEEAPRAPGKPLTGLHPFFVGLLEALPETGADWPQSKREQWLETARNIFSLVFTDPEQHDSRPAAPEVPTSQFERRVA